MLASGGGPASAQGEFPPFAQAGLTAHNTYRARHGSPPMILVQDLVTRAQQCAQHYAQKGTIDHSCAFKNNAGENLAMAVGGGNADPVQNVQTATKVWYDEIRNYDFNHPGFSMDSGHFTQLVWKASTRLGIGFASQNNKRVVVALYVQTGNMSPASYFEENVPRPR
ncbi:CAP family protein [Nocardia sp. NPDC023852]|uniref:CAP family protein n=1 Tax=Nocardia sp. NPDC023852 TaxID=3154697 RepID=UPI00340B645A